MTHDFAWQRRAARWGSAAIGVYCLVADWLLQPLHLRGWFQAPLAALNSLAWIAMFPGYVIVAKVGLGRMLSPPHRISAAAWWVIFAVNLVLWAVVLRLLLRVIFPARSDAEDPVEAPSTPGRSEAQRSDTPDPAAATSDAPNDVAFTHPTRRSFMTTSARIACAGVVATAGYSMLFETRWFEITRRRHAIRGLPPELSGLRIVQLTDIHHGPAMSLNYVREVIAATNALNPDLVLLTGDYVHRSPAYIDPVMRELAELRAKVGVVGVLGNHDWWESAPRSRECFAKAGIPLIDNDRLFVSPDRRVEPTALDRGLCVAGVGDYFEDRILWNRALRDVPAEMPRLLLSHNPDVAEHPTLLATGLRIDLMLAGHTHGGQVKLPLLGTPIVPSRFGSKYVSGLVQGPACPVYISRGIGTTVLPLRFRVAPEIAVIELQCAEA
jgi:predicted MPP superfamily phosphohydrolase